MMEENAICLQELLGLQFAPGPPSSIPTKQRGRARVLVVAPTLYCKSHAISD